MEPMEPIEEMYSALEKYSEPIPITDENVYAKYLVKYKINRETQEPFLLFYMARDFVTGEFVFPELYFSETKFEESRINAVVPLENEIIGGGIDLYYFVDDSSDKDITYLDSELELYVLVDEIMNHKKVKDIPIHHSVIHFFSKYTELLFLNNNEMNESYEVPIVGYNAIQAKANDNKTIQFHMTFGNFKKQDILGTNFYFSDYENVVKHKKKGDVIVRYAVFLGNCKVIMNREEDPEDASETAANEMGQNPLMARITDYDGKWAEIYDSVYLAPLQLEDGSEVEGAPLWAVKQYLQQTPLTYHNI
jgi:hypothetical protein